MLKRLKLEIGLATLIVVSLVAVLAEDRLLEKTWSLTPADGYGVAVYDDRGSGGQSVGKIINHRGPYEWKCDMKPGPPVFCGFEVIFDPVRMNGLDLSGYDTMRVWLDYEGDASTIRMSLRNYNPIYSTPGVNDSTKYNQIEFEPKNLKEITEFAIQDFFVANWWTYRFKIPPDLARPEFDNIVVLEVATGTQTTTGKHLFRLHQVEFVGRIVPSAKLFQGILGVWLFVALVYLAYRILSLKNEVKARKARENELLQINTLLDMRRDVLEKKTRTDHLTGAFNRQGLEHAIQESLRHARDAGVSMTLIILDIDHFKHINDTYGHQIGDEVLSDVSRIVQTSIREDDSFARWGGEEFVVLCKATAKREGKQLAEKLRQIVAEHVFNHDIKITVSMGVATLNPHESIESLFARADKALYLAKKEGRNKVVLASSS